MLFNNQHIQHLVVTVILPIFASDKLTICDKLTVFLTIHIIFYIIFDFFLHSAK